MKAISLVVLTGSQALLPMQVAWTRRENVARGDPLYLNTSVVVGAEAIKLVISFMLLCSENSSLKVTTDAVRQKFCVERVDTLKVAVPGFLYTIQAALVYYAMDTLSPPIFQVTYQLKILTTAMLSVVMLQRPLGCLKWFSLLMLTAGAALVQVGNAADGKSSSESKDIGSGIVGLIALLCACFTSGLAGVWLEKMLKQTKASIWMRNVQLAFFGVIIAIITAFAKDGPKIMEFGLFGGFGWREQLLTFHQGVTGLASAAVLKYADNILKCFAGVSAILITSVATAINAPDSFTPDFKFIGGSGLVMMAIFLYNLGCPTCAGVVPS
jgi:UDP-sugar transporter A1/2/3